MSKINKAISPTNKNRNRKKFQDSELRSIFQFTSLLLADDIVSYFVKKIESLKEELPELQTSKSTN